MKKFAVPFLISVCLFSQTPSRKRIVPEDYNHLAVVQDPQISPDGRLVAYSVGTVDEKANKKRSDIWVVPVDGSAAPRRFTTAQSSSKPRWSPDGTKLAFVSSRQDSPAGPPAKPQVFELSMSGGEALPITNLKDGVSAFAWSPDGRKLACISRSGLDDALGKGKEASDVKHYVQPFYKYNGVGFFDNRRAHLWVADVATGKAQQITSGQNTNDSDPQWSPDGTRIAFVSQRVDASPIEGSSVQVVPAAGGTPIVLGGPDSMVHAPRWSPDGTRLAWVADPSAVNGPVIWVSEANGGKATRAVSKLDAEPTSVYWLEGGKALFFGSAVKGEFHLFHVALGSGKLTQLTPAGRSFKEGDIDEQHGVLVYTDGDSIHSPDLYASNLSAQGGRRLTDHNKTFFAEHVVQPVERFSYRSVDAWDIDGFLIKPVGWEPGKKYPMVLIIHGGPSSMYGSDFNQDFQAVAAKGWAVFYTNPRGSSGYGDKFMQGVKLEWGGKTYLDIMKGVDVVLEKNPWIDKDRLGVTGGSFGGYMTNWIVGHTNRFKAAVTIASISDMISIAGTRDLAYSHSAYFGGDIWQNFDLYWKYSPLHYAKDVKTPTLVLHGDADQRVPLEQGEQWFRALKHFGVTSELVIFPREDHSLAQEPKHRMEVQKWRDYWFERFLNGIEQAPRPNAP